MSPREVAWFAPAVSARPVQRTRFAVLAAPCLAFAVVSSSARSLRAAGDEGEPRRTVVLADLGLHIVALGVQRVVSPRIALQASAGIYVPWTQTKDVAGLGGDGAAPTGTRSAGEPRGAMVRLRPFFYLGEKALRGLWISPFIQGGFIGADRAGIAQKGPAGAIGVTAGYAWLVASRVHVALGAGIQVHGAKVAGGSGYPSYLRPFPTVDIAVGYAF